MAIEQDSKLVHPLNHFFLNDLPLLLLRHVSGADGLQGRHHCVLAGVVGVVAGGPVEHILAFLHSKVVGNGNGLIVGHQEAILRPEGRAPALNRYIHSRLRQVDRRLAAFSVLAGAFGHPFLVGSPPELRRLMVTLVNEPFHRPCVPKLSFLSGLVTPLGVPLSYVDPFDSQSHHEHCPVLFVFGLLLEEVAGILGQVEDGLLDEPADHSGVGSTAGDRSGVPVVLFDFSEKSLSHSVVGALGEVLLSVRVVASPFLLDGVDVENSLFLAVLDDVAGRSAAGQVNEEANLVNKNLVEYFAVVVGGESDFEELDLFVVIWKMDGLGVYDGDFVESEVPLDQRDCSSAD